MGICLAVCRLTAGPAQASDLCWRLTSHQSYIREGEIKVSRHSIPARAVFCLAALALLSCGPAHAVPGICLSRNPAPPAFVSNDGTGSIRFDWTVETGAGITCSTPYTFEVLDSSMVVQTGFPVSFTCPGTNPFSNFYVWNVPLNKPCGCYYGRLTFYSNWCSGSARTIEDQALTAFIVGASAQFRVCKFLDINGNGTKDPGDPPIQGWSFLVHTPFIDTSCVTGDDGCCTFNLQVNCTGTTSVQITDVLPPGWIQTTQGGVNPFTVLLVPGPNPDIQVGNWQPITICGFKFLDQAPWPWTSPHWSDPPNPGNPPCTPTCCLEPTPTCPQTPPPAACVSPTQNCPAQGITTTGIAGVTVSLFNTTVSPRVLVGTTVTDADGSFCFGPLQYRSNFDIEMDNPAPSAPQCNPPLGDIGPPLGPLAPWPGAYVGTVATSVWPCPNTNFTNPHLLQITLPIPVTANQEYGCNFFFNRQPSRLIGKFCPLALQILPSISLGVGKDGFPYVTPSVSPQGDGSYEVPAINVEPQGIRSGTYRLTPPVLPDPTTQSWSVTTYCDTIHGNSTFPLPVSGFVDVGVGHSADVRVDFCVLSPPNKRQCFIPVTFTQQGWHDFCDPNNTIVPGGMVYNRFPIAFADYTYFSVVYNNLAIIGQGKTITWEGTSVGLKRLCLFMPQTGACGKLDTSYLNPWTLPPGVGGALAGETLALQMNIAYNDRRLMPRTAGYDLEKFTIASGLFKGKTVREVRNIANSILGGAPPCSFGLTNCQALVDILAAINANYEFVNYDVFNDRGFLIPDAGSLPFGPAKPATPVIVP